MEYTQIEIYKYANYLDNFELWDVASRGRCYHMMLQAKSFDSRVKLQDKLNGFQEYLERTNGGNSKQQHIFRFNDMLSRSLKGFTTRTQIEYS